MPAPLPVELRERICQAYDQGERSQATIAKRFLVDVRTVERLLTHRQKTGSIEPGKSTGRPRTLTDQQREKLRQAVTARPDATLRELLEELGIEGTTTLIDNELKRLGFSRKKVAGSCSERTAGFLDNHQNKQLNFLQHVRTLLEINGRCAVVVPDNVLFEGGAGETVRRNLMKQCDVHTLLRLPTGIFYAQGVKANVLFFTAKPGRETAWTNKVLVYDLRTNRHFTLKTNSLQRDDLNEFVNCYKPGEREKRKPLWSESNPEGRWRAFDYEEIEKRDKANLDIFWLKDKSLEDSEDLPEPDILAQEIADDLQTALDQFSSIADELKD